MADLPTDVADVLAQLLAETRVALEDGERETARDTIASAERVARNKLPAGEPRATLLHGCERVLALLSPEDEVETAAALAYVRALETHLPAD